MIKTHNKNILNLLQGIEDPSQGKNIVELNFVKNINLVDKSISVTLEVPVHRGPALEPIRKLVEKKLTDTGKFEKINVILTSHESKNEKVNKKIVSDVKTKLIETEIKRFVAIASGKGGVGKSTTTTNLAVSLKLLGYNVGVLDADVYGPSQPRMMGVSGRPSSAGGDMVVPLENYGIKLMSMGVLVPDDTAMIWRGPMVQSALTQMLDSVAWGNLDIILIDLPPGTGDIQISLAQQVNLSGAIIVSTPQDIALLDVQKSMTMFQKANVKLLGMIENMSFWKCPKCGSVEHIFGRDGVDREAKKKKLKILGKIPLNLGIRKGSDSGIPIVISEPDSVYSECYNNIASEIIDLIDL